MLINTVFPRFLPMGTINFSTCQDAGTIQGWEQNEGESISLSSEVRTV